jgi:hypothetical protein
MVLLLIKDIFGQRVFYILNNELITTTLTTMYVICPHTVPLIFSNFVAREQKVYAYKVQCSMRLRWELECLGIRTRRSSCLHP